MDRNNDAKYLLIAFAPLCVLLGLLTAHYRGIVNELEERTLAVPSYESFVEREIEYSTNFYGLRYEGASSNWVDAHVLYFGAYEKPLLHFLQDAAKALWSEAITFVDVGANTGQHTIFAARFSGAVHAFEPYPPVLAKLRNAVEKNKLANVVVHPVGLGAEEASFEFHPPVPENLGVGSFVSGFAERSEGSVQLRVAAGDAYFEEAGIGSAHLIKIDVEGYEQRVLEGLQRVLDDHRPLIVMEVTAKPDVEPLFESEQQLRGLLPDGYELSTLAFGPQDNVTGRYALEPFQADFSVGGQWTVVAYPTEFSGRLPRRNLEQASP